MASLLNSFQIVIHRSAAEPAPRQKELLSTPYEVTFEEVYQILEAWPRMFIEPDGSFVWVGQETLSDGALASWQLDGHLYDRDGRLLYVELQGTCPLSAFERILRACRVTLADIAVEQRRAGTIISGQEFTSAIQ